MNSHARFSRLNLILGVAILVLVNLLSTNLYQRWDLTASAAYSLSPVSRDTLAQVEDPLRVKVFYTAAVPAPYNGVRQYLLDLLREYDAAEDRHFSYEVVDVSTDAGRQEARQYGLQQVEIQEVRSDEFQSRAVYLGAVVLYGNVVERVDQLTTTGGLEYRLTTAMRSAVTQVDALSGTSEPVQLQVLVSPDLAELQIQGLAELETQMMAIHERVNRDNYGRIEFEYIEPAGSEEIQRFSEELGLSPVRWESRTGEERVGLLEVVLRYQDRVTRIPLEIFSGLFGGYSLDEPANIEESVRQALRSLVSAGPRIAYATDAGAQSLGDYQRGAGAFSQLVGERYEVIPVELAAAPVPPDIDTLVVNGPTQEYPEIARYHLDQFVMRGGSVMMLLDRHRQNLEGMQPTWEFTTTGLPEMLQQWGVNLTDRVVLDEESFVARQRQGQQRLFQAPVITGAGLNRESPVTRGLEDVIVLNTTEILPVAGDSAPQDLSYRPILSTSGDSWTVESPSEVGPWISGAPESDDTAPRDVAVMVSGRFPSTFDGPVAAGESPASTGRFRASAVEDARILVISSSALTTAQMLDPANRTPNGTFLMNAVDVLNGAPGVAELRSKGLGVARLDPVEPAARAVVKWTNTIVVPLLVLAVGLVVWRSRRRRSRRVRQLFERNET